jgi:uncharacterized protein (DUF1501 family)
MTMKPEIRNSTLTRRTLLATSTTAAAAAALAPRARAAGGGARPVLVQIFLRGAMDGLTTVVPHGDGDLYTWRPTLAIQPPGNPNGALDLDGFFGLAPAAAPLLTPYSSGHLAIVHASGSIDPTRSHFEAFVRMEYGDPALPLGTVDNGWITRYLAATAGSAVSPLRAIGASNLLPYTLSGATNSLPIPDFENFAFPGRPATAQLRVDGISQTYGRRKAPVGPAAEDTLASILILNGIDFAGYVPANGAAYPATVLGERMKTIAALIKAGTGVEAITVDVEGWDLHAELGPITGSMAGLLDDLTRSIEAFYLDMLTNLDDYVLVCLSEFGRRVEENASAGTDHGHGNAMFLLGGHVAGGQVHANWPGLSVSDLDNGDLAITTDYRDVLGEILLERLGVDPTPIFPLHPFTFPGLIV